MNDVPRQPHIVIIGGGFAGLSCAKALGNADVRVTVIDRRNYHLFSPLLYQVATAALSPADITEPIRKILAPFNNIEVVMGEVIGICGKAKRVVLESGERVSFDKLIIATGSRYNYFGHTEWEAFAPGLKTIDDARQIRNRLLLAFEKAERHHDPEEQRKLMTIVIVGGGPTGVEIAGAVAELARFTLASEFQHIDATNARIILVEAADRPLAAFPDPLSDFALTRLRSLGVEVMLNRSVEAVGQDYVKIAGEHIAAFSIIWGAGIKASPVAQWLGEKQDRIGRTQVRADFSLPSYPNVYVIGDSALYLAPGYDGGLPALAQVAKQQGQYLGSALKAQLRSGGKIRPFQYDDHGNTAIIGRNAAVIEIGKFRLRGRLAWILWAVIHVYLLVGFENRIRVSLQWLWRYFTFQRGARLITGVVYHGDRTTPTHNAGGNSGRA